MPPRSQYHDWRSPFYTNIVRLEGQISTAISLLTFRSYYISPPDHPLSSAVKDYFHGIRHLIDTYLAHNLDLANAAQNLGGFHYLVQHHYFPLVSVEMREHEAHWPKLLFFQALQVILEDEERSVEQALVDGWKLYIHEESYPAKWEPQMQESWQLWAGMSEEEQSKFLSTTFAVSANRILSWGGESQAMDVGAADAQAAGSALLKEMMTAYPGVLRDVLHPPFREPDYQELSECPICLRPLAKGEEDIDSPAEHRPIKTICDHVFGQECIQRWLTTNNGCPLCRKDLFLTSLEDIQPEDILQRVDRELTWQEPQPRPDVPRAPNSYLDRLALVFGPAKEVKRRLVEQHFDARVMDRELSHLSFYSVFLARDRLQAILDGDSELFKEVVALQVQVAARVMFHEFIRGWHPDLMLEER